MLVPETNIVYEIFLVFKYFLALFLPTYKKSSKALFPNDFFSRFFNENAFDYLKRSSFYKQSIITLITSTELRLDEYNK